MHYSLVVGDIKCVCNLDSELQQRIEREGTVSQMTIEGLPLQQLEELV